MAKFDAQQAAAFTAITQLINEWGYEVDTNYGRSIKQANVLTKDCRCEFAGQWIRGLDDVAKFYAEHDERLAAREGAAVIRQIVTNFRVGFTSEAEAEAGFTLLLFAKVGEVPFSDYCDPVEVADVRVDCRREADGHWRISMLDSDRIFRRD
ncbi:MAG: nuclear transport factor 2 family protein [Caulobacter sp.]|nr:nuclear transport factor 2 family protein [Caulobacter sp.]